ncbi:MAG: hypothetical protein LBT93_00470 [Treponema sp.]|nr:hypothetical protein [Treponema sp.]
MEKSGVTRDSLIGLAGELGIRKIGFLSPAQWRNAGDLPPGTSPREVWPPVKGIVVLGIPDAPVHALPANKEFGGWDVRNSLLDTAAYRLSLYLNREGYPSVNIPADAGGKQGADRPTVPVFSHHRAARYAGLVPGPEDPEKSSWRFASVFTALDFEQGKPAS